MTSCMCILCMRRDVSYDSPLCYYEGKYSLHAQRCFSVLAPPEVLHLVFSACAEMFLGHAIGLGMLLGILCMRRDVSQQDLLGHRDKPYSLHAQRCFPHIIGNFILVKVFSACAEMFLI